MSRYIPDQFKTEMCEQAVKEYTWSFISVPDRFKTQEMCTDAVKEHT